MMPDTADTQEGRGDTLSLRHMAVARIMTHFDQAIPRLNAVSVRNCDDLTYGWKPY